MGTSCNLSVADDDSQDQALQAAANLAGTTVGVQRYGVPSSSYGTYGKSYQPVSSYGSYDSYGQGLNHKAPKSTKSWTKHIFKSSNKGATTGSYPSYVVSPYGPPYRPTSYDSYPTTHSGFYGSPYAPNYGSSYQTPLIHRQGFNLPLVQPPLVGSYLYSRPPFHQSSYGINYGAFGTLGGDFSRPPFIPFGGIQSYTPTLVGAFDHYRGPIHYGGFRPTLGPYGGQPYSELLSVTDSYGRPILPYSPFNGLLAKKSSDS